MTDSPAGTSSATEPKEVDDELDELLDSALEDFDKETTQEKPKQQDPSSTLFDQYWNEEMLQKVEKEFIDNMEKLFNGDVSSEEFPEFSLAKMAEVTEKALLADMPEDSDFVKSLYKGLKDMQSQLGNVKSEIDEMKDMLGGMNLGPPNLTDSFFSPCLKPVIMDLFYPMMKEVIEKFPDWIEKHKAELSQDDLHKHNEQMKVIKSIIQEIEDEDPNDPEQEKTERFQNIMGKIKDLEKLGNIPPELVDGQSNPDLSNIQFPLPGTDLSQCSIM